MPETDLEYLAPVSVIKFRPTDFNMWSFSVIMVGIKKKDNTSISTLTDSAKLRMSVYLREIFKNMT